MHIIDAAILDGSITTLMLIEATRKPLPPESASYWGDCMRRLFVARPGEPGHTRARRAAVLAAMEMGQSLTSIQKIAGSVRIAS